MGRRRRSACHQIKLPFDGLDFQGRNAELETLQRILNSAALSKKSALTETSREADLRGDGGDATRTETPLVMVQGYSGVGKSALLETAFRDEDKCWFCMGKHEKMNKSETWNEVLEELVSFLEEDKQSNILDQVKADLEKALGAQHIRQLKGTFAAMHRIFTTQTSKSSSEEFGATKGALVRFIRVVVENLAQTNRVLVLCLEDLQWSDYTSLALLLALATETKAKGLVLVGTYRDNEVKGHQDHIMNSFFLSELKERNYSATDIELQNLSLEELNNIVSSLMGMRPEKTLELSEIVMRKTDGNVFFALQLLRVLHQESLLYYSITTYEWGWDLAKVASEADLSENVAELVTSKLNRLPPISKKVLMIGSCVGAKFHGDLLKGVLKIVLDKEKADGITEALVTESNPESEGMTDELRAIGGNHEEKNNAVDGNDKESLVRSRSGSDATVVDALAPEGTEATSEVAVKSPSLPHSPMSNGGSNLIEPSMGNNIDQRSNNDVENQIEDSNTGPENGNAPTAGEAEDAPTKPFPPSSIITNATNELSEPVTSDVEQDLAVNDQETDRTSVGLVDFESMIEDGLLTYRNGFYRFSHDRIEHAANDLFETASERAYTHHVIGRYLKEHFLQDVNDESGHFGLYDVETVKMVCCEQLNLAVPCMKRNPQEIVSLVRLNLEAAVLSSTRSAFQTTIDFLRTGLSLLEGLGQDPWLQHYELVLKIHNLLAGMLNVRGDHDAAEEVVDTVLNRAHSDREKQWAYVEKVNLLSRRNQMKDAQKLGMKALKKVGVRLLVNAGTHNVLLDFFKVKQQLKKLMKTQKGGIVNLPECQDEDMRSIIYLMNDVAKICFYVDELNTMTSAYMRSLLLSLKHGVNRYSAVGLSYYGCLLGAMGDFEAAYSAGCMATQLGERFFSGGTNSRAMSMVLTFTKPLKDPLQSCLDPSLKYYSQGMEAGDTEFAICNLTLYVQMYLFVGLPLRPLVSDLTGYEEQLKKFGQTKTGLIFEAFSQGIHNLWGKATDPFLLNGDFIREGIFLRDVRDNFMARWAFYFVKLYVTYYLRQDGPETKQAAEVFWELKNPLEGLPNFFRMNHAFLNGMAAMAMEVNAKRGQRRKYRMIRERSIKLIKSWEKKGVPWVSHMVLILDAERDRWDPKKKRDEIKAGYDAAIRLASRTGYVNDGALANERCARYFFTQVKDEGWGSFYMRNAVSLYLEWGANAKVALLRAEFPNVGDIFSDSGSKHSGFGVRARERFSASSSSRHFAKVAELFDEDGASSRGLTLPTSFR